MFHGNDQLHARLGHAEKRLRFHCKERCRLVQAVNCWRIMRIALAVELFFCPAVASAQMLDVTIANVEEVDGTPALTFTPQGAWPWERILRANAHGMDFNHLTASQIREIRKRPVYVVESLEGYEYCVTAPADAAVKMNNFWVVFVRGVFALRPSGIRACAEFAEDGMRLERYRGTLLAAVPAGFEHKWASFVIRTAGARAEMLPSGNRSFSAKLDGKAIECSYSEDGAVVAKGTIPSDGRLAIQSWFALRIGESLVAFVTWKAAPDRCEHLYSLFKVDGALTEVSFSGDGCDV
jgi:hypothetical protein